MQGQVSGRDRSPTRDFRFRSILWNFVCTLPFNLYLSKTENTEISFMSFKERKFPSEKKSCSRQSLHLTGCRVFSFCFWQIMLLWLNWTSPHKGKAPEGRHRLSAYRNNRRILLWLGWIAVQKPLVKVTPLLLTSKECDQFLQEWNLAAGFSGNLHLFEETNLDGEKLCIRRRDMIGMVNSQDLEMLNPVPVTKWMTRELQNIVRNPDAL